MTTKNEQMRLISLEDNFMNHNNGNDILYAFMLNKATYDPKTQQLYLSKNQYIKHRSVLNMLLGHTGKNYLSTTLDKLIKKGLIAETNLDIGSHKNAPCYIFPNNEKNRYQLVNNEILLYVVYTRNLCAIRIYTYLYNKFLWKQSIHEEYEFTIKELKEALGWSSATKTCDELIKMNLESFQREGIIQYADIYTLVNGTQPSPRKVLKFVAATKNQLRPLGQETILEELESQTQLSKNSIAL